MTKDFGSFVILYCIICLGFALVGNLNFVSESNRFETFMKAILTVVEASLGNFGFNLNKVEESSYSTEDHITQGATSTSKFDKNLYIVWVICAVVIFNMILINLIVAILANTYNIFDQRSAGLYLSKILMSRDEMNYDNNLGAFLCALPPLNLIQLPFLPVALSLRDNDEKLIRLNQYVMLIQYILFMLIFQFVFTALSLALIPFAWIIGTIDKARSIRHTDTTKDIAKNLLVFVVAGPLILLLDTFTDFYYFWQVMFKTKLRQIIIERELSTVDHKSLRSLMGNSKIFSDNKIKTAHSSQFVSIYREQHKVIQNILFLMFQQIVPEGGYL